MVNRDNKSKVNPMKIADGVSVDARVLRMLEFLAAAQRIDQKLHLISGYRSVAYQTEHNSYVQQEMAADPSLTESPGEEKKVQTYSATDRSCD